MTAAATVGVGPEVHYSDPVTGITIMDFISARPLAEYPGGAVGLVRALGALIAELQTAQPFPMLGDYPEIIEFMLAGLSKSAFCASGELAPHAEGLARIRAALPWNRSALVASHNDPNPRNILFDGERLWLIDWELGFRNDPLVDIAIVTTDLAETPELECALLEAAFGSVPDRRLRARLAIIRLLTRLFYGCVVLDSLASTMQSVPEIGQTARTPAAFRAAVAEGSLASGTPATAYAFGKMSLAAFVDGLAMAGFEEMLQWAGQG
jgi:Ser/Thr protein kinase RdoA (MazF antagonist)